MDSEQEYHIANRKSSFIAHTFLQNNRWRRDSRQYKNGNWRRSGMLATVSCPVYLPKCNRQWQNAIRAVRPNSNTHYWSRAIYRYRNCTRGQQTLKHSCYFIKGPAMWHSRSAKLIGYLTTPESERATLRHNRWKYGYEIHIQMSVYWQSTLEYRTSSWAEKWK